MLSSTGANASPTTAPEAPPTSAFDTDSVSGGLARLSLACESEPLDAKLKTEKTECESRPDTAPRLMIAKLVLRNFKSYAGTVAIGPFHKSFTSIVGPNGSGKSNVIDALLFVFGFKAKKMRQGKLSDLIHNSANFPNLDSAGVEVHFHEIIDLPGPDAYRAVEGSALIVSRTVEKQMKGDKSTYRINGRTSTFSEVTDLLKSKGVDLDHKRFLILQGEVESIALMKPKAQTEHEDGLLEYLEDIIGTSRYKELIEALSTELDGVSEERDEKLNRLKIVEKEKTALEPKKKEAEEFIQLENQIVFKRNQLHQIDLHESTCEIESCGKEIQDLATRLEAEREKFSSTSQQVAKLETAFAATTKEFEKLFEKTEALKKESQKADKKEVELREKDKHLATKKKKLEKALKTDSFAKSEHKSWMQNYDKDAQGAETELKELMDRLVLEEKELEAISEALKGKTQGFQAQIEKKQRELVPWTDKINERQARVDVSQSELDLLVKRTEAAQSALGDAKGQLEAFREMKSQKELEIRDLKNDMDAVKLTLEQLDAKLQKYLEKEAALVSSTSTARDKVAEARLSMQSSQNRGAVLSNLLKQRQSGKIPGICGRLGDLGVIDDKYDVAITTACGQLDNIVVETVEAAQRCIEFLKVQKLGRATFLCLDKMAPLTNSRFDAPEHSKRLFDLVTAKEDRFRTVFYHVLRDTLVTADLPKANRIAFQGARRNRVVTLEGQLIDASGTMSGGGSRPQSGGMNSKFSRANGVSMEQLTELEAEEKAWEMKMEEFLGKKAHYEEQKRLLVGQVPDAEFKFSKLQMDLQSVVKQIADAEKQVQVLSKKGDGPSPEDLARITVLRAEISSGEVEIAKLQVSKTSIDNEIKELQEQILQAGGVKLRSQKATVDGIVQQIDGCNEHITKLKVEKASREKAIVKLEASIEKKDTDMVEIDSELSQMQETLAEVVKTQTSLRGKLRDLENVLDDKEAEKTYLKAELDSKSTIINNFRAVEMEFQSGIFEKEKKIHTARKTAKQLQATLADLKYQVTGFEEEPLESLSKYTADEMAMMDPAVLDHEIKKLNEKIAKISPNLSVLTEYRQKLNIYLGRFEELEVVTQKRDEIRTQHEQLRKKRLDEFMDGFYTISYKLKEMYQMITLGGNAELELVDSMDPFSEGIIFSVMPPKKSWKNICNLSGGEKTLSSLALVFALHHYKPTPLYFMDEIDAALDFRNVSIVANYIKERTKNAQFIIISLRNNMFELADRLVGIYKTDNTTKSIAINPNTIVIE
ncbi:RecF/RecN/SMC protein [Chytriomyces sp. MP71]|nr:RecF/RecN/SMC protein [Chytriomyces sp. MP71]